MKLKNEKELLFEMLQYYSEEDQEDIVEYLYCLVVHKALPYDYDIDKNEKCQCGHPYFKHFYDNKDPYEGCNASVHCKCEKFVPANL